MYHKVIVIEASTICNLACPFCAHDKRLKVTRHTIEHERLRLFTNSIGKYAAAKEQRVLISWLGGEPLLNKNVLSLTEELQNRYPLFFSATTNGTKLLEPSIREHIKRYYAELTISLDGFSPFHDHMRGRPGLFAEVGSGLKKLSAEAPDLKLRINMVLMKDNFAVFPDLCRTVASWGVREITFNQLGGRDRPEFYPEHRLTIDQVTSLPLIVREIQNAIAQAGSKLICSDSYFHRLMASVKGEQLPVVDCGPGSFYLFVNARGQIAPCSFTTKEYGVDISSIQTAEAFEELPASFLQKKLLKQAPDCHDCPCTNVHGKFSKMREGPAA